MACKRNCIEKLIVYFESIGIEVNIGKNKARGNQGLFKVSNKHCRIDISKCVNEASRLNILIHEFAHYLHYKYDNSLKSLKFILKTELSNSILEELIDVTVHLIPKESATPFFSIKKELELATKDLKTKLSISFPSADFSLIEMNLAKIIQKTPYKYLLKHDKVKVANFLNYDIFSIEDLNLYNINENCKTYLLYLSKKRALKRINTKINRLNKYYNSNTELFARSIEVFLLQKDFFKQKAPQLSEIYTKTILDNSIPELSKIYKIINTTN